ncbi:YhcH/YjgK/YiaL family protein [Sporomusa acidovorans]|uniref:Toxin-antitoxin biofilm protein TabA n=1 Tax=Sporomusa acidovorans (strain ATCC 49682 / DSM 3132 / Mol) TaxID=1123286 RepID=A0ABZ3J0B9_SPOA4|nr:YhcH/YjgK/YiaL family protein [Sporomusa acidovorans]OZC24236.1 toxin-antitoxin biofilm protein TabA [Sporomusa acidovorans DSM 3132]SDF56478.1 YhcH/YjgK/YiaL family protein [Sporomusa acidovorans]
MIFGHISTLAKDAPQLHPILVKGLTYLAKTDLAALPPGNHEIEGRDMYVAINEYETQPKNERRAEAHADYLDIQYLVSGRELIAYSPLSVDYEVLADELAAKDVIFYKTVQQESDLVLTAGVYAIFFPWDVHRPNCSLHEAANVKKAVLKMRMSLLK